jgi:hypothetical protein
MQRPSHRRQKPILNTVLDERLFGLIGDLLVDDASITHHLHDHFAICHECPEIGSLQLVCVGLGAATVLRRRGSRQERKKHDGECESINGLPLVFNPTGATRGFTPIPIPIGKAVS